MKLFVKSKRGKLVIPERVIGRVMLFQATTNSEIGGIGAVVDENSNSRRCTDLWFAASSIGGANHSLDPATLLSAFTDRMLQSENPESINTVWHTHPFGGRAGFSAMDEHTISELTEGGRKFYFLLFADDFRSAVARGVQRIGGQIHNEYLRIVYAFSEDTKEGIDDIRTALRAPTSHSAARASSWGDNYRGWASRQYHSHVPVSDGVWDGDGDWRKGHVSAGARSKTDEEWISYYAKLLSGESGVSESTAADLIREMGTDDSTWLRTFGIKCPYLRS